MADNIGKAFGTVPLFNPAEGLPVRAPLGEGAGWWAGAPSATFDPDTSTFYLVYRLRLPRELGRGYECRIAASYDGVAFTDIWALPKSSLDALSLERASLLRGLDGTVGSFGSRFESRRASASHRKRRSQECLK